MKRSTNKAKKLKGTAAATHLRCASSTVWICFIRKATASLALAKLIRRGSNQDRVTTLAMTA